MDTYYMDFLFRRKSRGIFLLSLLLSALIPIAARAQYDPCEGGLCRVHFDPGQCDLKKESLPILDEALRLLKQEPKSQEKISIIGHTDNLESSDQASPLSLCRAQAVETYFKKKGIPAKRLELKNEGDARPLVSNEIEPGRQQNRRVEIVLPK